MSANYSSQANSAAGKAEMWNQVDTLGGNLMTQGGEISNIFGKR